MSSVNNWNTVQCPKCKADIRLLSRPILDPVLDPELYKAFLADSVNPKSCSRCGISISIPTPTTVNGQHCVGVALENPSPISAVKAFNIVETLTNELGVQEGNPRKPILIVGRCQELRRILSNRTNDRFCAILMPKVAMRNHGNFVEMLLTVSDAYHSADQPEVAYWMFSEAVGLFNELYFLPDFFELLELTAMAAGDRIANGLRMPQTAQQNFRFIQSQLEPHRHTVPEWCLSTYFCFYEEGPHPAWHAQVPHMWSTIVDLLALEKDGSIDMKNGERHQVFVPVQAVVQEELTVAEQAREYMFFLMTASEAARRLPSLPRDVQKASQFSSAELGLKWDQMSEAERAELAHIYHSMTGLDFHTQFQL